MIFMPDLLKASVDLMQADESKLTRRVYNLGSMSFTPDLLQKAIKKHIPGVYPSYFRLHENYSMEICIHNLFQHFEFEVSVFYLFL